ncbi:DUF4342 domain-containing protein [Cognatiyoonia sp. IB215182]|uniref:DUF4342 domain-containing protein n=1 Tax=Cognatiyoonia sp. IB215182 TaxID=3097353 RepID=UPI002A1189F0|nr:DUF4342 domain-containing protein [Cognatiyoonia sp. IB215182]MDX8352381.1 DUF4342 domain-containing protein [Cognatiyoonia sp. IB215182]
MAEERANTKKTVVEEVKVDGKNLVERVKEFAREGNVRRMRIIADDGDVFLETPLNIGLVVGGVVTLAAPWLAILGAIAALVSHVRIEVERETDEDEVASETDGAKTPEATA